MATLALMLATLAMGLTATDRSNRNDDNKALMSAMMTRLAPVTILARMAMMAIMMTMDGNDDDYREHCVCTWTRPNGELLKTEMYRFDGMEAMWAHQHLTKQTHVLGGRRIIKPFVIATSFSASTFG